MSDQKLIDQHGEDEALYRAACGLLVEQLLQAKATVRFVVDYGERLDADDIVEIGDWYLNGADRRFRDGIVRLIMAVKDNPAVAEAILRRLRRRRAVK